MTKHVQIQADRRRSDRIALRLTATMRDGSRSRAKARVIDISTHGCRIECPSSVAQDSWVWLSVAGLETQYSRVVWHCQEYIGLEFTKPLSEAVFDKLLQENEQLPESAIADLRAIASRTQSLARQAGDENIAKLAELSRRCAVDAVVEGLKLNQAPPKKDA